MAFVDWIKIEHTTPDKSEIHRIAEILNIDSDTVMGKLIRLWIWADQNSKDGNTFVTTLSAIDRICYCQNFGNSMLEIGWLEIKNGKICFCNFDRHNSKSAKNRAETARRLRKHRETQKKRKCNDKNVTPSSSSSTSTLESNSVLEVGGAGEGELDQVAMDLAVEFEGEMKGKIKPCIDELAEEFKERLRVHGIDKAEIIRKKIHDPKRLKTEARSIPQMFQFWNHFDFIKAVSKNGKHDKPQQYDMTPEQVEAMRNKS